MRKMPLLIELEEDDDSDDDRGRGGRHWEKKKWCYQSLLQRIRGNGEGHFPQAMSVVMRKVTGFPDFSLLV